MRWDSLFDDLEGQLAQEREAEEAGLAQEEERLRIARLSLRARLAAVIPRPGRASEETAGQAQELRLELRGGRALRLRPHTLGRDWLSGDEVAESGRRRAVVVPVDSITRIRWDPPALRRSIAPGAEPSEGLSARIGLAFVLRDLARRRAEVEVLTGTGPLRGTIDRVARDHLDLREHEHGTDTGAWSRTIPVLPVVSLSFEDLVLIRH